ncbi:hypothetical protein FA15DRAFT_675749 [Coprinopsis marcescibilis]|uniref:Uncharacterized protein n=1 Tax=Coprinopsis marcescibilis TaxID=230819 RepID=A0A5C3KCY6_COPMA|nr:hypothetical protein FA15DRAFT_675749 [Coprinopsis marcescibilis]
MGFGGEMSIPPRAPVVPRVRDDDDNEDAEAQSRASADYDQGPGTQTPTSAPHAKKRRKLGHNQHTSLPDGEQGVDDRAHSGGDEGEGEGAYHDPGNLGYFQETVDDKLVEQLVQLQGAVSELSNMVHQQEEATRDEIDTVFTDMFEQLKEELVREGVQGVQEDKEEGEGEEGEKEKENEKENGAGGREDGAEEDMVVDDDSQTNGGGGGQVDGQQAPPPQDQVLPIKAPQPLSIEGLNEELGNMKIEVDKATQDTNEMLDILSVWGGQMEQLGADYPVVADAFVKEVGRSEEIQQKYERLQAQQEEDSQRLAVLEQALKAHLSMPVTPPASPPMPNVDFILENIEEPIMDVLRDAAQPIVEEFRGGVQNKWESDVGKVYGGVYEKVKGTMNVLDLIQERVKSVNGVR